MPIELFGSSKRATKREGGRGGKGKVARIYRGVAVGSVVDIVTDAISSIKGGQPESKRFGIYLRYSFVASAAVGVLQIDDADLIVPNSR